ncbi:MAG TPA: hypothetical protein VGC36_14715 [Rhizomicrobium sp.]
MSVVEPAAPHDALDALIRDPFVARCLRKLLAGDRAALTLLSAGVSPVTRRPATRRLRARPGPLNAYRQGRVAQPAVLSDWRNDFRNDRDGSLLRRYPLVLALLNELTDL